MLDGGDELAHALVELVHQERLKPTLVSNSHMKVARFIRARRVSRSATRSYLRASFLITVPSPNQPPAPTPANVMALPSREMALILTRPDTTPVQESSRSPRWQM